MLIHSCCKDSIELKKTRIEINRIFDQIVSLLDQNDILLNFSDEEIKTILGVNSFVDNSGQLMHDEFDSIDMEANIELFDEYSELVKNARKTCLQKME